MGEATYIHGTLPSEQQRLAALNRLINPSFLKFLDLDGAQSVLEVGCGLGLLTREVALQLPQAEVVGIDCSAAQLAKAVHELPNLQFRQGNANCLDFEDNRFDVVYCRWVLEHVTDPLCVLQEMRRVVRPGGQIFAEENDTAVQRYDPPLPHFERLWAKVAVLQDNLHGDSFLGRRLFRLFKTAGINDIRLQMGAEVHWSGTAGLAPWIENEAAIVEGCASELVSRNMATQAEIEAALLDLRAQAERDDATS